jgi:hypothetical protein
MPSHRTRDCPAELLGRNCIFLHPDAFDSMAGKDAVDGRLYVQANNALIFRAEKSDRVVTASAFLDAVQRSVVKIALNERVLLAAVPASRFAARGTLRAVTFSVDYPLASQREPLSVDGAELAGEAKARLDGAVLAMQQYVLVAMDGTRLRLRVVNLEPAEDAGGADPGRELRTLCAATDVQCRTYGHSPIVLRQASDRNDQGTPASVSVGDDRASGAAPSGEGAQTAFALAAAAIEAEGGEAGPPAAAAAAAAASVSTGEEEEHMAGLALLRSSAIHPSSEATELAAREARAEAAEAAAREAQAEAEESAARARAEADEVAAREARAESAELAARERAEGAELVARGARAQAADLAVREAQAEAEESAARARAEAAEVAAREARAEAADAAAREALAEAAERAARERAEGAEVAAREARAEAAELSARAARAEQTERALSQAHPPPSPAVLSGRAASLTPY